MLPDYFRAIKSHTQSYLNSTGCDPQHEDSMNAGPNSGITPAGLHALSENAIVNRDERVSASTDESLAHLQNQSIHDNATENIQPNATDNVAQTDLKFVDDLDGRNRAQQPNFDTLDWTHDAGDFEHTAPARVESIGNFESPMAGYSPNGAFLCREQVSSDDNIATSAANNGAFDSPHCASDIAKDSMQLQGWTSTTASQTPGRANIHFQDDTALQLTGTPLSQYSARHRNVSAASATHNADANAGLSKYRVGEIPSFRGRSQSSPPPCGTHYTFIANWPPQIPPSCELGRRIDVFPPNDAPLHVWIQAYALRWGTWAADIKDDSIREQVLAAVTDKMRMAWDTAIREGYYSRASEDIMSYHQRSDSDGQTQRTRKRAQSPSRLPAGLASEGKDKLAITNGELAEHGITMDMINDRVQARDFDAGELRYDEILDALDRDKIEVKDWSASLSPVVAGRNLLMYCFFAVQDSRAERAKLEKLLKHFTKDGQKRNTLNRIEIAQEREFQHMALATELAIQEDDQRERYEIESDGTDISEVDLTSNIEADNTEASNISNDETVDDTRRKIIELAQDVLIASTEVSRQNAFTSRRHGPSDFYNEGLDVGDSSKYQTAKTCLGKIFEQNDTLIKLKDIMKGQQPAEVLRIGHDARLVKERIRQQQLILQDVLSDEVAISSIKLPESEGPGLERQGDHSQQHSGELPSLTLSIPSANTETQNSIAGTERALPNDPRSSVRSVTSVDKAPEIDFNPAFPAQSSSGDASSPKMPGIRLETTSQIQQVPVVEPSTSCATQETSHITSAPIQEMQSQANLKQEYINDRWVPFLNRALTDHDLPPVQGVVDTWNRIKQVLARIGLSTEERNKQLGRFKEGYVEYLAKRGISLNNNSNSQSATSTLSSTNSPALSRSSTQSPLPHSWPSDVEILAAIPPQGIPAAQLMQIFNHRVGQSRQQFMHTLERLAIIDHSSYMIFPRNELPRNSVQHGTIPPPPNESYIGMHYSGDSFDQHSRSATPVRSRPGLVKLKVSQSQPVLTIAQLPPSQDENAMPDEMKSTDLNSSRGFTFRHLPHATHQQRVKMDDEIGEYIDKTCKARKRNPFGEYITFKDPADLNGPPVAHGFWDLPDKSHPRGVEWFYNGEDIPVDWNFNGAGAEGGSQPSDVSNQGQVQYPDHEDNAYSSQQPKIKLKLNTSTVGSNADGRGAQAFSESNPYANQQQQQQYYGGYNVLPPGYAPANVGTTTNNTVFHNPTQTSQAQSGQYGTHHPATINPALLTKMPYPSPTLRAQGDTAQSLSNAEASVRRATKRAATANPAGAGARKKKRRTNVVDDDEDYDPSQDD